MGRLDADGKSATKLDEEIDKAKDSREGKYRQYSRWWHSCQLRKLPEGAREA